uniref:WD repeat domain phosphoinositide-interacting protein 2 n=2 Tax=Macrostomum lignano TaxID=282301 RepID=A0A1I8G4R1_9PLAT
EPHSSSGASAGISAAPVESASVSVLHVSFNQDCSSLAVGLSNGYALYSVSSSGDKLDELHRWCGEAVSIVERHYSSSLVAAVMLAQPRRLRVMHFKKGTEICSCNYQEPVLTVRLSRQRLVVCLADSLHLHSLQDMKVVHTVRDSTGNRQGLCALCSDQDACMLAYPANGSGGTGEARVFDAMALRQLCSIPAHNSPLAALAFNSTATRLATASEKGTVIRVYSVPDGERVAEFRRGVKRCVQLHSLAFSRDSSLLACCSNTETLHVFCLDPQQQHLEKQQQQQQANQQQSWASWAYRATSAYLPAALSQDRDFATARLSTGSRSGPGRSVCALAYIGRQLRLLCAMSGDVGQLAIYDVDERLGGDCQLAGLLDLRGGRAAEDATAAPVAVAATVVPENA